MAQKPPFKEAFIFWLKLGFISFGGPAGQIAIMHDFVVEKKKWISESRFLHALNYCMLLPGPEAQQLATYIGWLLHGTAGGLVAGILFVLPSLFILLAMSLLYVLYGNIPWIYAAFSGLKPAVVAIVVLALWKISSKSLKLPFHYVIAVGAFVALYFFNVRFPLIILAAVILAFLLNWLMPAYATASEAEQKSCDEEESKYLINKFSIHSKAGFDVRKLALKVMTALALWFIPWLVIKWMSTDFAFWNQLIAFFTKAALVTFGGAYAVLPYVAQYSVEKLQWLSSLEMIDGLALGETTPGPLIMVLAFVGFMAGYNHFGGALLMGTAGLVATTYYTFLPCFLFILAGAPIIEKTQDIKWVKQILSVITAAVVGVVLNLTVYFGEAVVLTGGSYDFRHINFIHLAWVIVSVIAMKKFNIGMITWIAVSAVFGLLTYFLTVS